MIFASLGTMDMPFVRMAEAIDTLAGQLDEPVIVQTGHTDYAYQHAQAFTFCTKEEMQRYLNEARIVVLQGGWGAINEAMALGKRIVVMPRHNGTEHIHDQFQLVRKLNTLGCIVMVEEDEPLMDAVQRAEQHTFTQLPRGNAEQLIIAKLHEWFG